MNNAGLGSPYWYEWEVGLLECLIMPVFLCADYCISNTVLYFCAAIHL